MRQLPSDDVQLLRRGQHGRIASGLHPELLPAAALGGPPHKAHRIAGDRRRRGSSTEAEPTGGRSLDDQFDRAGDGVHDGRVLLRDGGFDPVQSGTNPDVVRGGADPVKGPLGENRSARMWMKWSKA